MDCLTVKTSSSSYKIYLENRLLHNIGQIIGEGYCGSKLAVITDTRLEALYGAELRGFLEAAGHTVHFIVVPEGEQSKSLLTLQWVYKKLAELSFTRSNLILAFGGGVIGDLAGFAAATYMRGVPYIQIPTTLLAQTDSSVGGKVAVNLEEGKNLIGSFYPPIAVLIDPILLDTLSQRHWSNGMAEVIKYGAILDKGFFEGLQGTPLSSSGHKLLKEAILRCCSLKKQLVEEDEHDTGSRMLLNFGHTLGHAIEKYYAYDKYTHGEAVAIGMYCITKVSESIRLTKPGTSQALAKLLTAHNLPYRLPELDKDKLMDIVQLDKKASDDMLRLVLLKEIGSSFIHNIQHRSFADCFKTFL